MLSNASTPWIPGSSSDLSIQANAMLGLEDDASWKSSAGCQSPISLDPMAKENAVSCAFDSEWFIAPAPTTFHRTDGIKELSYGSSIAHHQQLEQTAAAPATPPSSALAGALNLEAFQLQSFLSRSMIASSSSQQQQQQQQPIGLGSLVEAASIGLENGAGSIALDSDGSILLDDNGHIIASSRGSFNSTAGSFVQSSTGAFSSSKNGPGSSLGICCSPLGMARSNTTISDHHAKVVLSPRSSPSKAFEGFNIFNGLKSPSGSGVFNNCGSTSPSPRKTGNRGDCPSNSTTPRKLGSTSVLPPPLRTATTLPKPLEPLSATPPCSGARPTLFQKRALSRNASAVSPSKLLVKQPMLAVPSSCSPAMNTMITPDEESPNIIRGTNLQKRHLLLASPSKGYSQLLLGKSGSPLKKRTWDEEWEDDEQLGEGNEMEDDESGDGSGVVHELGSNLANGVAGDGKKSLKKGMPAKNLLAERRRRKKLNDRLYMLRSVVPKITKMDRASILGDAIEYLKELLQRINDMHNELEAQAEKTTAAPLVPPAPALTTTPTSSSLAGSCGRPLVKEECSTSLSSPESQQPARIEVKMRDGKDFNIHMFCTMRPGLLLSMMKALDGLGLDVQQAVISCFNGFVFDIFRAETMKEGDVGPEEIKTVLLHTAGCQSVI